MKIAIFGGSFNPVHKEHVSIAAAAKRTLSLDKIIIMPSYITPQKQGRLTASTEDRLELCRLAFGGIEGVEVSDYEIKNGGVSYSYLTCRALKEKYPEDELYFILGADMLENFSQWKNPEIILDCVTLAVCARERRDRLDKAVKDFKSRFNKKIEIIDYTGAAVSSTDIRTLAALGENDSDYMPKNAADYLKEHSLYLRPELCKVKKYLTAERYNHTLGVALLAVENCRRAGVDELTALTAASLHDCAKYLTKDSPELSGFEFPTGVPKPVMHQFTGAHVAEHTFGVSDENILNAIRYHTSGRPQMTPLEKLIFLSDMLERGRTFDGVDRLREIFNKDLDGCMLAALGEQLKFLKSQGGEIYPLTQKAYEFFKRNSK